MVGVLGAIACRVSMDGIGVARSETDAQAIPLLTVNLDRGGFVQGSAIQAPRDGLYRVGYQAQALPIDGSDQPCAGDFIGAFALGDAFASVARFGNAFDPTAGFGYVTAQASVLMQLVAGQALELSYQPGGPDYTDAGIDAVQASGVVFVELVR